MNLQDVNKSLHFQIQSDICFFKQEGFYFHLLFFDYHVKLFYMIVREIRCLKFIGLFL